MISVSTILVASLLMTSDLSVVEGKGQQSVVPYEEKEYRFIHMIDNSLNGAPAGVAVENIIVEDNVIKIIMQSPSDARLLIHVPKTLLNDTDISYDNDGRVPAIFVDEIDSDDYLSEVMGNYVFFGIPFESGTEEIRIAGSDVPEFSGLTSLVAGLSIAAIIIATAMYRNKLDSWK